MDHGMEEKQSHTEMVRHKIYIFNIPSPSGISTIKLLHFLAFVRVHDVIP